MHSEDYAVARCLSVRLSVCPSVCHTPVLCVNCCTYPQSFFSPSGSPTTLVFPYQTGWQYSGGDLPPNGGVECKDVWKQELSYRQQIARQLRTQYAVCRHIYYTVTLKSRLSVTQGHWKRNHWIDHTRFSSSRVIWCWILLWHWNVGYRSLKLIESGNIWKLGYGFLFASHSNYGRICSRLWDIQCQRMAWPGKPG